MDAFPDLMNDSEQQFEVRITGHQGGEDPEREQFESAFPDIQPSEPAVSDGTVGPRSFYLHPPLRLEADIVTPSGSFTRPSHTEPLLTHLNHTLAQPPPPLTSPSYPALLSLLSK